MSDEVKAIPLEERMARICKAIDVSYIGGRNGYDWAHLFKAAAEGEAGKVNTNSDFFQLLKRKPQLIEILGCLLCLTPAQLKRIKDHQGEPANGTA